MEDELKTTVKFTEHIFDGSGNKIMNSIQYTAMSIIPLLIVNNVLETQLPAFSPNTPPVSMIIETAVHMIVLLIVLYFVDRTVRYFPSSSGDKYGEVSFETIGLLLVLMVVNSHNSHLGKKVIHLTRHARERFTNREGLVEGKTTNGESFESGSQPPVLQGTEETAVLQTKKSTPQGQPTSVGQPTPEVTPSTSGKEGKVAFTQRGGGVTPMSALESFAMTGGNYSPF